MQVNRPVRARGPFPANHSGRIARSPKVSNDPYAANSGGGAGGDGWRSRDSVYRVGKDKGNGVGQRGGAGINSGAVQRAYTVSLCNPCPPPDNLLITQYTNANANAAQQQQQPRTTPTKSRLLTLPPELRNKIYALALTKPYTIDITKDLLIPGLLQTNRQLRHEALALWLEDNRFRLTVQRFDARLCAPWNTLVARMVASLPGGRVPFPRVRVVVEDSHNWKNLLDWCREVHKRENRVVWVSATSFLRGVVWSDARRLPLPPWRRCRAAEMRHDALPPHPAHARSLSDVC